MIFPINAFYGMWGMTLKYSRSTMIDGVLVLQESTAKFIVQGDDNKQENTGNVDARGMIKTFFCMESLQKGDIIYYNEVAFRVYEVYPEEHGCGYRYTAGNGPIAVDWRM